MVTSHTLIRNSLLTIAIAGIFCCLALVAQAYHMVIEIESELARQTASVIDSGLVPVAPISDDLNKDPYKELLETKELPEVVTQTPAPETEPKREVVAETKVAPPKPAEVEKPKEASVVAVKSTPKAVVETDFAEELINLIIEETNSFRASKDLPPLKYDPVLAGNAKEYSQVMLRGGFMSHTDKSGCDLTCRFKENDYQASSWGENLANIKFSDQLTARKVADYFMTGWKKSAGHRDNLLSEDFVYQGIGVSYSNNAVYVSVQFAKK